MTYKLLIVEDDPFISLNIQSALQKKDFDIIGIAETVAEAEELFNLNKPDLCLIDIQLNEAISGIDFAKKLDKLQAPYFYITAQTDPITLTKVNETKPLGYIVKPFTDSGLQSSISVVWQQYLDNKKEILTIKIDGYVHLIPENNILFLEAFDNYCYIQTDTKRLLAPHTLKKTHNFLNGSQFFMSHRSYWVNTDKITSIGKQDLQIDKYKISLSRTKRAELLTLVKHLS